MTTKPKSKTRRGPQARGLARRQQLEDAAEILLETREVDEISLTDVANQAGIPVASSYSFYGNVNDLFARLLVKHTEQMFNEVERAIAEFEADTWQEIIEQLVDGIALHLRQSPTLQRLRLSGRALPEIRYAADRPTGADFAERLRALIDAKFALPEIEGGKRPFVIMLDMTEAILVSEYIRSRSIPPGIGREAKWAALAYLKLYIPEFLPRRAAQADSVESGEGNVQTQ